MNWFTKGYVVMKTPDEKKSLVENWGGCEHVLADSTTLAYVSYENDSFGREGWCMCEACNDVQNKAEDDEKESCNDCGKIYRHGEMLRWTTYDHYPAQGDEPTLVCPACRTLAKHLNRVARDKADYESEFGSPDFDDEDYDD